MLKDKTIGFIGAGNMAEALIKGLLKAEFITPTNIFASDVREERLTYLNGLYKINISTSNVDIVKQCDIIIFAVKPQKMNTVISEIATYTYNTKLIISIAAGFTIKKIQDIFEKKVRVIRAMPNTPALVLEGATGLSKNNDATDNDIKLSIKIFRAVGKVVVVDEELMDAVTGLSGSGPAYIFLIIDSLADAGVKMGLSRDMASELAVQTVLGSAKLVLETGKHPSQLKDMVTSPGGTAISGIHTLEEGGLRTTIINAVEAATKRSKELGRG